jgi:hypothetical protein
MDRCYRCPVREAMSNRDDLWRFGTKWEAPHFDGAAAFREMQAGFRQAAARHPAEYHESFHAFAGETVALRIVGKQLAEHVLLPFSHLKTSPGAQTPVLTIGLWDEAKGRSPRSVPPREELKWTETTVTSPDGQFIGQRLPHTFSCLDRLSGRILATIAWSDRIFIYERAKPLARLLLDWHNSRDVPIVHSGLVGYRGQGVLFVGQSGSGKSTSSLACVCGGLEYLSEDYVGLQRMQDGSFVGHSLYSSVFLETPHLSRFPDLTSYAIRGEGPEDTKSAILLSQLFPERLQRSIPIRVLAIVCVRRGASTTAVRPASRGEALLSIGPSSLLQLPNRSLGARGLQVLAELVEQVPCYRLDVGADLASLAGRVQELLSGSF